MPRKLGDLTLDVPDSWTDHSVHRLTEPMPDEPFERFALVGSETIAKVNRTRWTIWTCWVDCPEHGDTDAWQIQKDLFRGGYHLVSEHVPDRVDIEHVTTIATPTYSHPEYGDLEAIHIRYEASGRSIDEIHCFMGDTPRERVLVVVSAFPTNHPHAADRFAEIVRSIQLGAATAEDVKARWGIDP